MNNKVQGLRFNVQGSKNKFQIREIRVFRNSKLQTINFFLIPLSKTTTSRNSDKFVLVQINSGKFATNGERF